MILKSNLNYFEEISDIIQRLKMLPFVIATTKIKVPRNKFNKRYIISSHRKL